MPTILTYSSLLSIKIIFISTTIISLLAIPLKFYTPPITNIAISCLKPPYLYIVINCIIITIFASSKFEHLSSSPPSVPVQPLPHMDDVFKCNAINDAVSETKNEFNVDREIVMAEVAGEGKIDAKLSTDFVISKSAGSTPVSNKRGIARAVGKENCNGSEEKPPAATRFGHHRRIVKSSPEGGKTVLGVSKPRRHDTLETTWKTITDGRAIPLARHLKKRDTWETHGRHNQNLDNEIQKITKSETFSERSEIIRTQTPRKLKKEPSLSQDELNKRVEAFINKFNEDMRLQRQESLNQYNKMINRGAH